MGLFELFIPVDESGHLATMWTTVPAGKPTASILALRCQTNWRSRLAVLLAGRRPTTSAVCGPSELPVVRPALATVSRTQLKRLR